MNTASQTTRVSRLKKRFHDILAGTVTIDPRGAALFLEGLCQCAQDDPVVCLDAIIESAHGLPSVQLAMRCDLSVHFMNGLGSTALEYLLRAHHVGGEALDNVLVHVVDPPIFWSSFIRAFQDGSLNEKSQLVFARVLSRLIALQGRDTTPYRDVASRRSIQETLISSSNREIREMGYLVKHILTSTPSVTTYDVRNGPGGRHDNDFPNFRDIAILPTPDEITCQKPAFLSTTIHDDLANSETPASDYLDHTFRLLREDMIFDIRDAIKIALRKKENDRGVPINDVSMIGIYTGADDRKTRWGIKLRCTSGFWQLRGIQDEDARLDYLTRDPHGSKILRHQSLVCLVSGQDIISFGIVNRVGELLACNPPVIVFQPDGAVNAGKTLTSLRAAQVVQLIQVDAAIFAFEPVLTVLQKMTSVPLCRETLFWDSGMPIEYSKNGTTLWHVVYSLESSVHMEDLPNLTDLDDSQARSMIAGLEQRVSLIQGPPGTGKSFIGAQLAKVIHDETAQTILIVCYTNHALDQFLEDLLKRNIPDDSIVRLGGRATQSIEHLALHKQQRHRFGYDWDSINSLKQIALGHEYQLGDKFNELLNVDDRKLISHLEEKHEEFFNAFYVPLEYEDGMMLVGSHGQAVDEKYLFERWRRCQDAGVLKDRPHVRALARIWGMDRSARRTKLEEWRHEVTAETVKSICEAGSRFNELQDSIKEEFAESTVALLRQKRIIACTTTGAAIYAQAIKKIGPEVLLVEEAGEILESHILTALSPSIDQMILIGDHKQLRPKVNNYQLTVEKGEGFDLNRSLFERLVLKGYPHETLTTQHRMRPEISAFVRALTYPDLRDASSTFNRPDIRGVQSNVIFVDHTHPEDNDHLIGDRLDGDTKGSKQNTYEARMVLEIVRYLAKQGYNNENIVVLTPYLGQLHKLREALKDDNDPILNEMDSLDLARAGLSPFTPFEFKPKKAGIKLVTIDNYQGEEGDIVVASLTRSNTSNAIGFMDSPERLNVLLSRARDGLILIGNSQTFMHSKKGGALWRRFFGLLEKGQYVYQGFPIKCQRHPDRALVLKCASDFDEYCPAGGCTQPCGFTLDCGHKCTMKCHPNRGHALVDPHDALQCKHKMIATCFAGHGITWECRANRPACRTCAREAEAAEKRRLAEEEEKHAKQQEEERKRREEERKRKEEERKRKEEERKRKEEERKKQEEERKKQEEERKRQGEDRRKREVEERIRQEEQRERERKRLEEETRKIYAQLQADIREKERQQAAVAERRARLISERWREDYRAAAVARAQEYDADQERKRRDSEQNLKPANEKSSGCTVQ